MTISPESAITPVLDVAHLTKRYGLKSAVSDVSFSVKRGEILGLLGPNGAGKTTAINMILGVLQPSTGSIHVAGLDLGRRRSEALSRVNFAAIYATLPGNLTVLQNLRVMGLVYCVQNLATRIEEVLRQFDLMPFRNVKCGLLSSGEQTRANLAKAVLNEPELLLLDEPTASLDPAAAQGIRQHIRSLADSGDCGILWTSHNMIEVQAVCDRALFLSRGRILLEGDPRQLPIQHGVSTLDELFIRIAQEPLTDATDADV